MKTLNDYSGAEGVDKLIECSPFISEILGDADILSKTKDKTLLQIGGEVYKAHTETCNKLFAILDHEPENAISAATATAQVMAELLTNQDLIDFFTSLSKQK